MEVTPCPINTPAHVPNWAHPHWTCCAAPMWPFLASAASAGRLLRIPLLAVMFLIRLVSSLIFSGVLSKAIGDGLARTGLLKGYALGRAHA